MTSHPHTQRLSVMLFGQKVGELGQAPGSAPVFQYDRDWLVNGFPLTQAHLAFQPALQMPKPPPPPEFWGLFGVFNDSLPDGWGLMLMDRALGAARGWSRSSITGLDRLAYIGNRGMGALEYAPMAPHQSGEDSPLDISALATAAELVTEGKEPDVLNQLLLHGGSGGGARPKVTVARNRHSGMCLSSFQALRPGYEHWMVKFRSPSDEVDAGRAEMAYAFFARQAGLVVADTDLIELTINNTRQAYFASRRFDREADQKIHMLSLAGLLHASHRLPSTDYDTILGATQMLTQSVKEVEKAFRQMVFNVIAFNRDDHAKNFSFLFKDGRWISSPSYDLSMSPNTSMGGEHMSAINGSGNPTRKDVLALADNFDIRHPKTIIDEVMAAASNWKAHASRYDLGKTMTDEIGEKIETMMRRIGGGPGVNIKNKA